MLMGILYISVNILCIIIPRASSAEISRRAATMSTINLIPLLCGPRLMLMSQLLGISLRAHFEFHTWVATTAVAQALIHVVISVTSKQPVKLPGIIGGSSLGFLFLFSLHLFRRLAYEWFLLSHLLVAVTALVAIWLHLESKKLFAKTIVLIGVSLWTAATSLHFLYFLFRNFAFGRTLATAKVANVSTAVKVAIDVPRPWDVKAGQYIFLSIPAAGLLSSLHGHPFMIVWWQRDINGLTVFLLVKPRSGFTARLAGLQNRKRLAFIDGPYGLEYDFGEYKTVLMFATGIGIAGHLLYIRDLLTGYNDCTVNTRRVILIWQIDNEENLDWVKQWMDDLLVMDTGYILDITLCIPIRSAQNKAQKEDVPYGTHNRLRDHEGPIDITDIVKANSKPGNGKMVVSMCSNNAMADKVRREVQQHMDPGVRLVELDYEPSLRQKSEPEMDFSCRGMP
ncbi:hypothetical protein V496_00158 [Pseudogymnoascus sp. VKM F-4515 (FW-2607)]|nr:hypothetical protein V496_00158 [Pseudogymnoascus sp. VKM F-4515 (FW-2607)]